MIITGPLLFIAVACGYYEITLLLDIIEKELNVAT
jgi:hypothetical protein